MLNTGFKGKVITTTSVSGVRTIYTIKESGSPVGNQKKILTSVLSLSVQPPHVEISFTSEATVCVLVSLPVQLVTSRVVILALVSTV